MRKAIVAAVVSLLSFGVQASTTPASASSSPTATFSFVTNRVTHGQSPTINYSLSGVPRGASVHVQRDFGTQHVFKNIATLTGKSGSVSLPGVPMGRYRYRIRITADKKAIGTSAVHKLYSYTTVTVDQMCGLYDDSVQFRSGCNDGTIQVGSTVYAYAVYAEEGNEAPDQDADLVVQNSSCRSVNITYALSNDQQQNGATTVGAELAQSSADPQETNTSTGSIGVLSAPISSPNWDLVFYSAGGHTVFWNGSFSCWTLTGST